MPLGRPVQPYLLVIPSLVLAALVIVWPLGELIVIALHDVNRFGQLRDFSPFGNFLALAKDGDFQATIPRTLIWTVGVVGGTILVSLPVAMILNDDFYGRGLARVIVLLPWSVSLTMTAIVWRWALKGDAGLLNESLRSLGFIHDNIQWLARPETAFPTEVLIGIVVSIPFTVTILLGGLSSIPDELYDAAAIEGAGSLQRFRFVTLPLLQPFIGIAIVLNTIYVFNSFPIIWAMTEGGPAGSTDIMITYLYKLAFRFGKMGEASAASLLMFLTLILFTLIYFRLSRNQEARA